VRGGSAKKKWQPKKQQSQFKMIGFVQREITQRNLVAGFDCQRAVNSGLQKAKTPKPKHKKVVRKM